MKYKFKALDFAFISALTWFCIQPKPETTIAFILITAFHAASLFWNDSIRSYVELLEQNNIQKHDHSLKLLNELKLKIDSYDTKFSEIEKLSEETKKHLVAANLNAGLRFGK